MPTPSNDHEHELRAILQAYRDLGPEYEDQTIEQIRALYPSTTPSSAGLPVPEDIFWRLSSRERRRLLKHLDTSPTHQYLRVAMPILGISIPLLAIATQADHTFGLIAVLGLDALALVIGAVRGRSQQ